MTEDSKMLYAKLARIIGRLDRLPKTGYNQHFKYHFVTDADVSDTIRQELAQENIAFFASMVDYQQENGHTRATFEFTFACGDSGQSITSVWTGEAQDKQDKGLSKAATSAEKYFLLKTFMLSTGDKADDPDSDTHGEEPSKSAKTASKTSATPPAPTRHSDQSIVHDMSDDVAAEQRRAWLFAENAEQRLVDLAINARDVWLVEGENPLIWPRVYKRFARIIRLPDDEPSPQNRDDYLRMMRDFCPYDAGTLWKEVQLYESEDEQ